MFCERVLGGAPSLLCSSILLCAISSLAPTAASQSTAWLQVRNQESQLNNWYQHAMAYDVVRRRTILFGGRLTSGTATNVHWEFDGVSWLLRTPAVAPPARLAHTMVYDPLRQRSIVFGGYTGSSPPYHGDTWEWDGTSWQQFAGAGPGARTEHGMVYDPVRARVLLFGGLTSPTFRNDMWEYDGASWTAVTPVGAVPAGRAGQMMAYDSARSRTVMFGGRTGPQNYVNETWEWDGTSWALLSPAASPAARGYAAIAYDPVRQRTVMSGGTGYSGPNQTWEWDGSNWTSAPTAITPPSAYYNRMVYDTARQRLVLHGYQTWLYGTLAPATAATLGVGCGGPGGPPVLTSNVPFLGNPGFRIEVQQAPATALAILALGFGSVSQPLGNGCTLYVAIYSSLALVTDGGGTAGVTIFVPDSPSLRGLPFVAQAGVADPQGPYLGFSLTAARVHQLGD